MPEMPGMKGVKEDEKERDVLWSSRTDSPGNQVDFRRLDNCNDVAADSQLQFLESLRSQQGG